MAIINLLPSKVKRAKRAAEKKPDKVSGASSSPSSFNFLFIVLIVIAVLLSFGTIWAHLFNKLKSKEKTLISLEEKVRGLKPTYQKIEELTKKKKELLQTLSNYEGILEKNIFWSEKLSEIKKSLPGQVWLTGIYVDKQMTAGQTNKILVIKGSSTSLIQAEIMAAITQFIDRLKEDSSFSNDFADMKLGQLQSAEKGNLNVMDFSLYCKFK